MKKVLALWGLMLLVLLASCTKAEQEEVVSILTDDTNVSSEVAQEEVMEESQELAANYREYDEEFVGLGDDTVIFFHASWCGSCKKTDDSLIETWVPDGTRVLKADFDTSTELRQKYGVIKEHTFVQIDENGEMIKKWSGSFGVDDIKEQLEAGEVMEKSEDTMMKDDAIVDDEDAMMKDETMMKDEGAMMEKENEDIWISQEEYEKMGTPIEQEITPEDSQWLYMDYSVSGLSETENTVIFFHANWCPSCRAADSSIGASEIPENLTILKADFDSETDLRKKYGVVSQHTFVQVDANGDMIKKWTGGTSVDDIVEKL